MDNIEVLVLSGSPGSGKSTLANSIAERLRQIDVAHAVIDLDELGRVYPERGSSLMWNNLRAIWPNYVAMQTLKVILPVCVDSKEDFEALKNATNSNAVTICELVADDWLLKERVTKREPNEYWQGKLRNLVENYSNRDATDKFGDFRVRTDNKSIDDAVQEIVERLGWQASAG